ncbi:MAG: HIT domain-containing protein [Proteobacteria bacterium]|jgi:histidine triad (HIT) family protein|nr:HIT domain-containing protein [Pseudomonadota bacterium]NBP14064.1 HIT domain-containing protein [bacterium]
MEKNCIFCKIINQEVPVTLIAENQNVFVIKDINPKASLHYLIIPKKHIKDISQFEDQDKVIAADLLLMAQQLSQTVAHANQFKLIANNGAAVGQSVFHLHFHFLAGIKSDSFAV